ncbi:hypothetical protein BGM26_13920 [Bacillus sp. FJAT-29790]|uniref:hypothetical protein n=1 Tax=Bacillus sp. FJAT-29790 TaxID=1895002 RepID=UPI001C238C4F|nr:hypothetical protein [Bacillus sp. FJAT-29790]MBU8880075.1 hypothetical protein [Bacillus sp. FJAT-29790]
MRFIFAIPLILIGAFLIGLTSNGIGVKGNVIMDIIGCVLMLIGFKLIVARKKNQSS